MRQHDLSYFASWLVEPKSLRPLSVAQGRLVTADAVEVPFIGGAPVFEGRQLSTQQQAELSHARRFVAEMPSDGVYRVPSDLHEWSKAWIYPERLRGEEAALVCLGGAFLDDLPRVSARNKFNVDHLAHEYLAFAAEVMSTQDTTFVSCPAESLPFSSGVVDVVYSRNALDHFDNPYEVLTEVHRILKPDGLFLFACYLDSTFLDPAETKVVDADFIDRFVRALFAELHCDAVEVEPQLVVGRATTRFVHFVGRPRPGGRLPISSKAARQSAELANSFQLALHERVEGDADRARRVFGRVVSMEPVVPTDAHRQVYAALQLLAMTDAEALKAAALSIRRLGLEDDWREAADTVLGHHGWTLAGLPDQAVEPAVIEAQPFFGERRWFELLTRSAGVLADQATTGATRSVP